MTAVWPPPTHPRRDLLADHRPGPVRIMDAAGRVLRVVQPDVRLLPCRQHRRRACWVCGPRIAAHFERRGVE